MKYVYKFPVVKGVQARKEYYIAMVPLNMLAKLFVPDEEYVLPEYRAQRKLNESRIPIISRYIVENRDSYVFSALAASIDGNYKFIPDHNNPEVGVLEVDMQAKMLINDGQHRKAAIIEAIKEDPTLEEETISVVFYEDMGLERSQQMFTDLNKHAVKTSNSISELYDSRDPLAVVTRKVAISVAFFNEYTDKERDILGKYSSALFTLNNLYTANKRILKRNACDETFETFCIGYWTEVSKHMIPWIDMQERVISKSELREKYIAAQAVVLQALGRSGSFFYENKNQCNYIDYISKIEKIDWKRSATIWKNRVIRENGRMINNEKAIILAANVIKKKIGIPLSREEKEAERELMNTL